MTDADELRPIEGLEGLYSITCDGRIWSHPRAYIAGRWRNQLRLTRGCWVAPYMNSSTGYLRAVLRRNGKHVNIAVHRAVAQAWVPNPNNLPQVNHKNGNKLDPRADNLEWVTPSENGKHAWATGLNASSEKHRAAARRRAEINHERQRQKTHCIHGHPLSGDNLYVNKHGYRSCWTCRKASKARQAARAEARP